MDNVDQQVPPVQDQTSSKNSNNLSFLKALSYGFVIVSIGIIIAVGGYLLGTNKTKTQPVTQTSVTPSISPTPDPTAGWKTYEDVQNNFLVKYPQDWISYEGNVSECKSMPSNLGLFSNCVGFIPSGIELNYPSHYRGTDIRIFVFQNPNNLDIKSFYAQPCSSQVGIGCYPNPFKSAEEVQIVQVGGISATEFKNISLAATFTLVAIPFEKKVIEVEEFYSSPQQDKLFGQILSTFKFTDQNQTTDTSSWKIYMGNGYSMKYPENFGANVWSAYIWPPTTSVVPSSEDPVARGCPNFPTGSIGSKGVTQGAVKINNIDYTLYKASDAAAGSSYNSYCYVTKKDQNYYVIDFVIRTANGCGKNCSVYCGTPNETACINFDLVNEVEKPIQDILSTFKFTN